MTKRRRETMELMMDVMRSYSGENGDDLPWTQSEMLKVYSMIFHLSQLFLL